MRIDTGVEGKLVRIRVVVTCSGNKEVASLHSNLDGLLQGMTLTVSTPGIRRDLRSHCHGIVHRRDRVAFVATLGGQSLDYHQLDVLIAPCSAGDAPVVKLCCNEPCIVRAMAAVIHGIAIVVHEIEAVHIIDVPVAIVIAAVSRNLSAVCPDAILKILVAEGQPSVNECHNDLRRACRQGL